MRPVRRASWCVPPPTFPGTASSTRSDWSGSGRTSSWSGQSAVFLAPGPVGRRLIGTPPTQGHQGGRVELTTPQRDRAAGVLLGQAVGDALGVPYEFGTPPGEGQPAEMLGGGLIDGAP